MPDISRFYRLVQSRHHAELRVTTVGIYGDGWTWLRMNSNGPGDGEVKTTLVCGFYVSLTASCLYTATTSGVWRWPRP